MVARIVVLPPSDPWVALDSRVALLSRMRSTLVISSRRPLDEARAAYEKAGADLRHIFILDACSDALTSSARLLDPEHEASVPNPAHLELIASRARRILKMKAEGPATVVVDDLATFLAYNPPGACLQMGRQFAQDPSLEFDQEYIAAPGLGEAVWRNLREVFQDITSLLPGGELAADAGTPTPAWHATASKPAPTTA